ncbi:MAG: Calx-beta domain-containing protein, partial [Planctomycetaceae bacterium]
DDTAVVSISPVSLAVTEGNAGSTAGQFTVSLSQPAVTPVTVGYATANGTAVAGQDYTAASGTLTFAVGETSKPVVVSVLGDGVVEANETFTVNLASPSGAVLGALLLAMLQSGLGLWGGSQFRYDLLLGGLLAGALAWERLVSERLVSERLARKERP